ncbi:MAG: HD domain-containing protein [bacterium]
MEFSAPAVRRRLGRAWDRLLELRGGRQVYVVGGALRDILLGRESDDLDFAVSGPGVEFAEAFARRVRGKLVVLSAEDDEARVVSRGRVFDFNGFAAGIEADLARRDFTVNAMACEVTPTGPGVLLDPFDGRRDLAAGVLRPVSAGALASDPLRLMRALRLGLELGLAVDDAVYEQGRAVSLERTAGERVAAELLRIAERPDSTSALTRLFELGRLGEILPVLRPVLADEQLRRHSFRTYAKVEETVGGGSFFDRFEPEWRRYFDRWGAETEEEPGLPYRRAMLKLAGLLHDIAKPETRFTSDSGEVHFYGHDSLGARAVARMARDRLKLSRARVKMLKMLVQEHMRLHLLATTPDLSERAIRRFFRDLGEEAFGLMMLCFADGWATAGRTYHLEDTITRMIEQKRAEDARVRVERFVTGDDLIAMGLEPGPAFKVILGELEELQLDGTLADRESALAYLRTNLPGLAGAREPGE